MVILIIVIVIEIIKEITNSNHRKIKVVILILGLDLAWIIRPMHAYSFVLGFE